MLRESISNNIGLHTGQRLENLKIMLLHCFLIYQDSVLSYLVETNCYSQSTERADLSARVDIQSWKGFCIYTD